MKQLRNSIAAIVAVLALTVTIAAQAGAFEGKKVLAETDCFQATIELATVNCEALKTVVLGDACSKPLPNEHVFALGTPRANPVQTCPGGSDFCCLFVSQDQNPCIDPADPISDQPQLNIGAGLKYYKVASIRCQELP